MSLSSLSPGQEVYLKEFGRCIELLRSQKNTFEIICKKIFESLCADGVVHVFGSGHSHSFAEEMFHRAGGLVPVNALLEEYLMPHAGPSQVGPLERLSGIGAIIFSKYDLRKGEVLLLASNSGINAATVELAEKAKQTGLITVGITSLTHSKGVPARSGKKLYEVVDHCIDTGTPVGDACVPLKGLPVNVAPLSGALTLLIGELITVRVAEIFSENNLQAPIYQSANTPGGDERNKVLEAKYRARIRHLR